MTQYYKDVLALRHAQDQLGNQEIELRINYETVSLCSSLFCFRSSSLI